MGGAIVGGGIIVVLFVIFSPIKNIVLFEYEKALVYRLGRFKKVLDAGMHWYFSWFTVVKKIDVRPKYITINGQEVTTSDGIVMKITLAAEYQVKDLNAAINKIANPYEKALYLVLQLALREIICSVTIDEIFQKRSSFGKELMVIAAGRAEELGLSLILVEFKDIMLPGEFKKIFAEVTKAKQEGLAILEKARAETAALRNLANAASMIKDNPALMHLRLFQSSGNTYVVGVPGMAIPIPVRSPDSQMGKNNKEEHSGGVA